MKRNQSGFTLIEIAIVLVIIGLLLGGVLKGQELINSTKVKNLATDFRNIPVYINGYQDKYKALPGDDANVVLHLGATAILATTPGTVGNGVIEGAWNSTTNTDESFLFWQHIRLAGFGPGSTTITDPSYLPTNTVGGRIGVTNSLANNPITLPTPLQGTYVVCSDGIPGKFAKQLDTTLDDGNTQTGSLMVTAAGTVAGGTSIPTTGAIAIIDDKPYLVCMGY
ncbi:MAG: prepilin-type N-terminal cleavage/methylation domain-containing protein [Gallionella sp.]